MSPPRMFIENRIKIKKRTDSENREDFIEIRN